MRVWSVFILAASFLMCKNSQKNKCSSYCTDICKPACKPECCDVIEKFRQLQRMDGTFIQKRNNVIRWELEHNNPVKQLLQNPKRSSIACENEKIYLGCESENGKIIVSETFYGRNNSTFECMEHKNQRLDTCISKTRNAQSHKMINSLCTGEKYCEVIVKKSTIIPGDDEPYCQDTSKYLKVQYRCIDVL